MQGSRATTRQGSKRKRWIKRLKTSKKSYLKERKDKRCLLTLDLHLFNLCVREKHSAGREL